MDEAIPQSARILTSTGVTRKHLQILTPDFPPGLGGIQTMLYELASGLSERWRVTVIAPSHSDAERWDSEQNFHVRRTSHRWGGARSAVVLAEMAVSGLRDRADVLLAGHLITAPTALVVAAGRPVAVMLYGNELWSPKVKRVIGLAGRRVQRFVAISRFTAKAAEAVGIPSDKITIVVPGARRPVLPDDCRPSLAALGLTDEAGNVRPYFLTVARLAEPYKGHDMFIRTLPALLARRPELRYVVAGDGLLLNHLRRIAISSGVQDATIFAGRVDEATKACLLRNCRAMVLLSREAGAAAGFEGFGIAPLEAALLGRPTLAGRSGALAEAVVDHQTGLLVDPESQSAVVDAAASLVDDEQLADRLGLKALARAESEFTWKRAVGKVDAELSELVR
jgi:phosphatidylinositol alpha-1,6-mannosyltransferase